MSKLQQAVVFAACLTLALAFVACGSDNDDTHDRPWGVTVSPTTLNMGGNATASNTVNFPASNNDTRENAWEVTVTPTAIHAGDTITVTAVAHLTGGLAQYSLDIAGGADLVTLESDRRVSQSTFGPPVTWKLRANKAGTVRVSVSVSYETQTGTSPSGQPIYGFANARSGEVEIAILPATGGEKNAWEVTITPTTIHVGDTITVTAVARLTGGLAQYSLDILGGADLVTLASDRRVSQSTFGPPVTWKLRANKAGTVRVSISVSYETQTGTSPSGQPVYGLVNARSGEVEITILPAAGGEKNAWEVTVAPTTIHAGDTITVTAVAHLSGGLAQYSLDILGGADLVTLESDRRVSQSTFGPPVTWKLRANKAGTVRVSVSVSYETQTGTSPSGQPVYGLVNARSGEVEIVVLP